LLDVERVGRPEDREGREGLEAIIVIAHGGSGEVSFLAGAL
jgi:hypothetical protein